MKTRPPKYLPRALSTALLLLLSLLQPSQAGAFLPTGAMITPRQKPVTTLLADGRVLAIGGATGVSAYTAELYDPVTGKWAAAGKMIGKRGRFTATLLPSGKVLLAGGDSTTEGVSTAELFDPATGSWTATGVMNSTYSSHTATRLPNGKVLVTGGTGIDSPPSAELYDPAMGTWSVTGAPATARSFHTAVLLPNGKVLVAGGWLEVNVTPLSKAELYDPATGKWTGTGAMTTSRAGHAMTLLASGEVMVAGGVGGAGGKLSSTEFYDALFGKWTAGPPLSLAAADVTLTTLPDGNVLVTEKDDFNNATPRAEIYNRIPEKIFNQQGKTKTFAGLPQASQSTATLLSNGKVLFAGIDCEIYDLAPGWVPTGRLTTARYNHTATLLPSGLVLVAGGRGSHRLGGVLSSAELFDPATGQWTATGSMKGEREKHRATLLLNGQVLVTGGTDNELKNLASAELYDPASGAWTVTPSPSTPRSGTYAATLLTTGKVLVISTQGDASFNPAGGADLFDPSTGTWTATGSTKTKQAFYTATLLPSGKVLAAGGTLNPGSAELYDPATGAWAVTGSSKIGKFGANAILLPDGKVLVASAGTGVEVYDPATEKWSITGSLALTSEVYGVSLPRNDGHVLVTGVSLSSTVATADCYDPIARAWSVVPGPALGFGTRGYTTTRLSDGRIFLAGGQDNGNAPLVDIGPPLSAAQLFGEAGAVIFPPAVRLTDPPNGQSFGRGANFTITAFTSACDSVVTNVSFFSGANLIGRAASPPYSLSWKSLVAGELLLTARATDNRGVTTVSAPVLITITAPATNAPPIVSIERPANGTEITQGANLLIVAFATDNDGSVTNVSFFNGANLIGQATTKPYLMTWSNAVVGSYSLTAKATDDQGATTVSAPVQVRVVPPAINAPPIVSIIEPRNGLKFTQGAIIPVIAFASDRDGVVTNVSLFSGAKFVGVAAVSGQASPAGTPYTYLWRNPDVGLISLTAQATDNQGATTLSAPVQITVVGQTNGPPSVRIAQPSDGATLTQGESVIVSASASDSDGSVANVSFFSGTNLIGQAASPPYSVVWSNFVAGSYSLTARATDNQGLSTISAPVQISVVGISPPVLDIRAESAQVILSWPNSFTGFVLQSTESLTPPIAWANVPGTPGVVSGAYVVTLEIAAKPKFYRLAKP